MSRCGAKCVVPNLPIHSKIVAQEMTKGEALKRKHATTLKETRKIGGEQNVYAGGTGTPMIAYNLALQKAIVAYDQTHKADRAGASSTSSSSRRPKHFHPAASTAP